MASGRGVAQTGSAFAWGAKGPGFKSRRPDHLKNPKTPWKQGVFFMSAPCARLPFPSLQCPHIPYPPGGLFWGTHFPPLFCGHSGNSAKIAPGDTRGTHFPAIAPMRPDPVPGHVSAWAGSSTLLRASYGPDGRRGFGPGPRPYCGLSSVDTTGGHVKAGFHLSKSAVLLGFLHNVA